MVTIHDLTADDQLLLELFWMLDAAGQGELVRSAAMAANLQVADCAARKRGAASAGTVVAEALKAIWGCAPPLPCGWASDSDFESEIDNAVKQRLGDEVADMVLNVDAMDQKHAARLAEWAEAHARRIGPDFCAPQFEDGYVPVESMKAFIQDWRDRFMANLRRREADAKR